MLLAKSDHRQLASLSPRPLTIRPIRRHRSPDHRNRVKRRDRPAKRYDSEHNIQNKHDQRPGTVLYSMPNGPRKKVNTNESTTLLRFVIITQMHTAMG